MKKWRKGIILLVIIGILIVARVFLFESVLSHRLLKYLPFEERYEKYILYDKKFRTKTPIWSGQDEEHEYILMFQWQYHKLVEEVRSDLYVKLDEFVEENQFVSGYKVDETGKVIMIECNKKEKTEKFSFLREEAEDKIEDNCYLLEQLTKSKKQYEIYVA